MAELTDRAMKKMEIELRQLQKLIGSEMVQMGQHLQNEPVMVANTEDFDVASIRAKIKWLKKFDSQRKNTTREFRQLFVRRKK